MQYTSETKSLPPDQFLTISANLLNNKLLQAGRTEAKRVFRDIQDGKVVPITYLEMQDKSLVRFDLSLDYTHYRGHLNFTSFRTSLALWLHNAKETLEKPDGLRIYQDQNNPRSIMFGVLAITAEGDEPSILGLCADSSGSEAAIHLKLLYLDTVQFRGTEDGGEQAALQGAINSGDASAGPTDS
ncbi:MAG: hypothetical protein V2I24_03515 [Halieaceae bacterium]|jgi:hypothetical protein|nr:hypothetical protein [Halieaceae bacterium]